MNQQIVIRKISAEETWALRHKVMWPTESVEFVKLADDEQGVHYGAFMENQLISVVSLFYQDKQVQFRKFATCEEQQKRGYGTQLLHHIFSEAKDRGADTIWCHARTDKVHFYQRFGLKVRGEAFKRDGKDYVLMFKCLTATENFQDVSVY